MSRILPDPANRAANHSLLNRPHRVLCGLQVACLCWALPAEAQLEPGPEVVAKWLAAHPKVKLISRVSLGGDYDLARVQRKDHADICVINTSGDSPRLWCWREDRTIDHLGHQNIASRKDAADPSKARVRLVFTPGGATGQAPAREVRFPEAVQRSISPVKFVTRSCPLPFWFPQSCVSFSLSARGVSKASWRPIKLIKPIPAWARIFAEKGLTKVEIPRDRSNSPMIAIQGMAMQYQQIIFGVHRGGRWLLSDPIDDQDGLMEQWSIIDWKPADRLLGKPGVAVHLTTNDEGNVEWSGSEYWFFFAQHGNRLRYAGRLTSGTVHNDRQGGPDSGYFRLVERQHCAMKIVGRRCVRLHCRSAERLCTNGAFRPNGRCKRQRIKPKILGGSWQLRGDTFKRDPCGGGRSPAKTRPR